MKDFKWYSYDRNWIKISGCKWWNGSILDQYKIINFNRLHIPPKMFVDLLNQSWDKSHKLLTKLTHIRLKGSILNMITIPKQVQWMKN